MTFKKEFLQVLNRKFLDQAHLTHIIIILQFPVLNRAVVRYFKTAIANQQSLLALTIDFSKNT